ncbi:hypothetical protein OE749_01660 [Aestuariibacter sp. AA17]|uniref:Fibronectin type-III domain-containing protein n=1 Tax=Fluctibacter corallii TaxID=2984329 RepID=A0ABT3A427_9ALTE|nr:hypothetical protein [Aestuariibacter sp. AA17]MCV2883403.1 hypothetical protein [Aestuariibacter sp. AA17]
MKMVYFLLACLTSSISVSTFASASSLSQNDAGQWVSPVLSYIIDAHSPHITKPTDITVNQQNDQTVIQWGQTENHWYKVEKAVNGGAYQRLTDSTDASFIVPESHNERSKYRIAACLKDSENCSDWVALTQTFGPLPIPESHTLEVTQTNATLTLTSNHQDFHPVQYKVEFQRNQTDWQTFIVTAEKEIVFSPELTGEYKLRAFLCVAESELTCSTEAIETNSFQQVVRPPAPVLGLNHGQYNAIRVFWEPTRNATNYRIDVYSVHSRLKLESSLYTSETEYTFNDALPRGNLLYFMVYACTDTPNFCSAASNQQTTTPLPWGAPLIPRVGLNHRQHNHIHIQWQAVPNARYYRYRVSDNGTVVYEHFTYKLEHTFPGTLPVGNLLDFQVQSCSDEHDCSAFSKPVSTFILRYHDSPPPRPLTIETDLRRMVQGQAQSFSWTMPDYYEAPVTFSFYETDDKGNRKLIKSGIQNTEIEYNIINYGAVTFSVEACHAEWGCGEAKPLTRGVDKAPVFEFNFSRLVAYVNEEITLRYSVPERYTCFTDSLVHAFSGAGEKQVIFKEPIESEMLWRCRDNHLREIDVIKSFRVLQRPLELPPGSITLAFSKATVTLYQPVELQWDIIDGVSCKSAQVEGVLTGKGKRQVTFEQRIEQTVAFTCEDAQKRGLKIQVPLSVSKLKAPILRRGN